MAVDPAWWLSFKEELTQYKLKKITITISTDSNESDTDIWFWKQQYILDTRLDIKNHNIKYIQIPVVPHKAVAEVSRIGNV